MNTRTALILASLGIGSLFVSSHALADTPPASQPAVDPWVEKQVTSCMDALKLNDPAKEARVKAVITTHLSAVLEWHNSHPAPKDLKLVLPDDPSVPSPKEAGSAQAAEDEKIDPSVLKNFNAGLAADLTPEQIEVVKDKITIGKVQFTNTGYMMMLKNPPATDAEKAEILKDLKQAREDSLVVKDTKLGKSAVFKLYKNKIKVYLNAHGRDFDALYKAYVAELQSKKTGGDATTQPD